MTYQEIIADLQDEVLLSKGLPKHLRPTYWIRELEYSFEFFWSMKPDISDAEGPCGERIFRDGSRELLFLPPPKDELHLYTKL